MKCLKSLPVALLMILVVCGVTPAYVSGQANLGSIRGIMQDSGRAAVSNAHITLQNEATGVVVTTTSSATGQYALLNLAPGSYTLTAESAGFNKSVQQHINVGTGSSVSLDVTMQV